MPRVKTRRKAKVVGYRTFTSSGGNICCQCNTRMNKGLKFIAPVTGIKKIKMLTGKSICSSCYGEMYEEMLGSVPVHEQELFDQRRFLEHFDKEK